MSRDAFYNNLNIALEWLCDYDTYEEVVIRDSGEYVSVRYIIKLVN